MMKRKKVSILGATGSIGQQTLNVMEYLPDRFELNFITVNTNISNLDLICSKYKPNGVVIADELSYLNFKKQTDYKGEILCGSDSICEIATDTSNDLIVSALVGFSGVVPTYNAINNGITVALANKETLVSAGSIIMNLARERNVPILAIDSEHSAILQCLAGEDADCIEKIILTASGGPFRNTPINEFGEITVAQALKHPNWSMGSKITIDSATMMNKGFEVIEAHWLFGLSLDQIEVVIHPQSIIHSLVQFIDGSVKAQLGLPDMRMPISYALTYPERFEYNFPRMNLTEISKLEFFEPDLAKYPCLSLAYKALEQKGNCAAVLNAANEICVAGFLKGQINFTAISNIIEMVLTQVSFIENPDLNQIIESDKEARDLTLSIISKQFLR